MTRAFRALLLAAASSAALALPAAAQQGVGTPKAGQFGFALSAGPEFDISGTFHGGAVAGPVTIDKKDWSDVYDYVLTVEGEANYGLGSMSEVALILSWTTAEADDLQVGSAAGFPIRAEFDDYQAWTVRAAFRQYFQVSPTLMPYVGVTGGVRRVETIDAAFTSDALPLLGLPRTVESEFYEATWVPMVGLTFGWRNQFRSVVLGLETGIQYEWGPDDDDTTLSALGLQGINDDGERWSIPVKLTIAF